jgi:hypothetical protein
MHEHKQVKSKYLKDNTKWTSANHALCHVWDCLKSGKGKLLTVCKSWTSHIYVVNIAQVQGTGSKAKYQAEKI